MLPACWKHYRKITPTAMQYNNFTSICDQCYQKGYHEKKEPCVRTIFDGCDKCGSHEIISKPRKCKGTNRIIDYSDCSKQFIPYYESKQRIKVHFRYGETKSGIVGKTTGWKPVLILMLRSNSSGSSHILSDNDKIL